MNQQELIKRRYEVKKLINISTHNALKCSKDPAEKSSHRTTKFLVADYCWENGLDFHTEVVFKGGQRADIVISDINLCIEVLHSEKEKDCDKKEYPLNIIQVKTNINKESLYKILDDLRNIS